MGDTFTGLSDLRKRVLNDMIAEISPDIMFMQEAPWMSLPAHLDLGNLEFVHSKNIEGKRYNLVEKKQNSKLILFFEAKKD
jgi:hypothetical protein